MLLGSVNGAIPSPCDGQQPPVCAFYSGERPPCPERSPQLAAGLLGTIKQTQLHILRAFLVPDIPTDE
jgi:hypothetical protein